MTEQERLDRETLLKRAATGAGAVYFAPVLTSAAGAEAQECPTFLCKNKRRRRTCRKAGGGKVCNCDIGQNCHPCSCGDDGCPCTLQDPNPCGRLEPCPGCDGNGFCFQDAKKGGTTGVCVDGPDLFCSSFSPCDRNKNCPAAQACFNSCCRRPLCGNCCSGHAAPIARPPGSGGPGMLYASA